jgi:hypothetical protein
VRKCLKSWITFITSWNYKLAKTKLYKLSAPFNNWKGEVVEFDMFSKPAPLDTAMNSDCYYPIERSAWCIWIVVKWHVPTSNVATKTTTRDQHYNAYCQKNSGYSRNLMSQLNKTMRNYRIHTASPETTSLQMRATYSYHSPCVRQVTNLFQRTNWRIGLRSWNTIYKLLKHQKGINSKCVLVRVATWSNVCWSEWPYGLMCAGPSVHTV